MTTPIADGPSSSHHYQSCDPLRPWNCGFTAVFIICLLHYNGRSIRTGNLAALRRPQHVEQHLAHSRRSINICGMNRVRRGQLSQCAEGAGWARKLQAPAWARPWVNSPPSAQTAACLTTVCHQAGQARAITQPRPQDSPGLAIEAATPQGELV